MLAALDVHRGGVLQATDLDRNTAANFIAFLDELDARVRTGLAVHLCSTTGLRTSPTRPAGGLLTTLASRALHANRTPLARLGRAVLLDPGRRLLKRGEFASVDDLVAKVMAFIAD